MNHRRPGFGIGSARAHEINFECIAIWPVERVQVLDTTAGLVENDANKLDQRQYRMQPECLGNVGRRKTRTDALARVLDLYACAFEQLQQRPGGEILSGKCQLHTLGNMRCEVRKRQAVDRTHAHRALEQLV